MMHERTKQKELQAVEMDMLQRFPRISRQNRILIQEIRRMMGTEATLIQNIERN